jgi:filamentous hemagglutinin family protein
MHRGRLASHAVLLAGVSVLALLTASAGADARGLGASWAGGSATTAATNAAAVSAQQAAALAQQSMKSLTRATQALQAMQAAQVAARQAAQGGANRLVGTLDVPNGMSIGGAGGLVPDSGLAASGAANPVTTWVGANTPTQTVSGDQTTVNIRQTAAQALLNWTSFNVGAHTTLNFDQQGNANWVALNRVTAGTSPSQILGQIKADGQVYIINQNGIIFGGSSQVNVNTLVASALPINDALLANGQLYSNPDLQFTFTAYAQAGGSAGPTVAFTPPQATAASQDSAVVVQPGAQITTATNAQHNGGRVVLIGPEVSNAGTITSPDGQIILAAGQQVALLGSTDPSLRGVIPLIGQVASFSGLQTGTATNTGLLEADRGDVWMAGRAVDQAGVAMATTSVSLNGRIDLTGAYNTAPTLVAGSIALVPQTSGTVTVGASSLIEILPEWSSSETAIGTSLALPSRINISGATVDFASNAQVLAPNAAVAITTTGASSQIYLDAGVSIDVSGSIVDAQMSENIIAVQLLGPELANSSLQRDVFRGKTIYVDIRKTGTNADGTTWIGTPLADVSGYVGLIQRTVGELTIAGGSVSISSGGSLVMQQGSSLNVSGGAINYQGGAVTTTRLIGADGHLYDISQALPNIAYAGISSGFTVSHPRWKVTEIYTSPLLDSGAYQPGYVQGGGGGAITISAATAEIDGAFEGATVAGPYQRNSLPSLSALSLNLQPSTATGTSSVTQDVIFQASNNQTAANFDPNATVLATTRPILLTSGLLAPGGIESVTVSTPNGNIAVEASLDGQAGGSLSLSGKNIRIDADVVLPGGTIAAATVDIDPTLVLGNGVAAPASDIAGRGALTVASGVTLSAAGLVVDDAVGTPLPMTIKGGTISLRGFYETVAAGSVLDVSGGVYSTRAGKLTYGKAGAITLTAGQDSTIVSTVRGSASLSATLKGYAATAGGALTIAVPTPIQIGGTIAAPGTLPIDPALFSQGGFATFSLTGTGATDANGVVEPGLLVAAGTTIAPAIQSLTATRTASGLSLTPILMSDPMLRQAPSISLGAASITLNGQVTVRGDAVLDRGASITLAATTLGTGSVTLSGTTVAVLGSIIVPGGNISIAGVSSASLSALTVLSTVDLAPGSVLSTASAAAITLNGFGQRTGTVYAGGNIVVTGDILAEQGALLDVSGSSGVAPISDSAQALGQRGGLVANDSNAGTISFVGKEGADIAATLKGKAGGPSAQGGSVSVASGDLVTVGGNVTGLPNRLQVTQSTVPATALSGRAAIAQALAGGGGGYFAAGSLAGSGFSSVTLGGNVQFSGPVTIAVARSLVVGTGGVISADSSVSLAAPYVALGQPYGYLTNLGNAPDQTGVQAPVVVTPDAFGSPTQVAVAPSGGTGRLSVNASDLLDLGTLVLQGMTGTVDRPVTLSAGNDLRGYGTFEGVGAIVLTAGQIYPVTQTNFTIAALDPAAATGSVAIIANGNSRPLPLSVGGVLDVFATTITQDGVLRAPIGTINLGSITPTTVSSTTFPATTSLTLGANSVTSVTAVDPTDGQGKTIPYGTMLNGANWIDPSGTDITLGGVPGKSVTLSAAGIALNSGSVVDISGGGDLTAYNWVSGSGGTKDILALSGSFAIIPGYQSDYAPLATILQKNPDGTVSAAAGWNNSALSAGDRITLAASAGGLPAGTYTLLPARYALLPGAFLVTPKSGTAAGTVSATQPDGSAIVSGYRANDLVGTAAPNAFSLFEIDSSAVVQARAQYDQFSANSTLAQSALTGSVAVPRLPIDAGTLNLIATASLSVAGSAKATAPAGGAGGVVTISSPNNIVINDDGTGATAGTLFLSARGLTNFGAQSLLIGGLSTDGSTVTVTTGAIEVANDASGALAGPDITLVASGSVTLDAGADIEQRGSLATPAPTFLIGNAATLGSGNGALLRISSDSTAGIRRAGVNVGGAGSLTIRAGAKVAGSGIILDSTNATSIDPGIILAGSALALDSGRISLLLSQPGTIQPTTGLVLPIATLSNLQSSFRTVALLSYSSIDLYGTGAIGAVDAGGHPIRSSSLSLSAAGLRGFNSNGGTVTLNASAISIANGPNVVDVEPVPGVNDTPSGTLMFNADTITINANAFRITGYAAVDLNAPGGIVLQGTGGANLVTPQGNLLPYGGGFSTSGNLTLSTAELTAATGATQFVAADSALMINAVTGAAPQVMEGLGASLTLSGTSVTENSLIRLPSGTLTLHATGAGSDVTVGGTLDAGGTAQSFFDQTKYTSSGMINLTADFGNVVLGSGSIVNVSAPAAAGNAGMIAVSVANGSFTAGGRLTGTAGAEGRGGSFSLDVASLPSTAGTDAVLNAGGFTTARAFRARSGNVVIDGTATAASYTATADAGAITVSGMIDAAGATGGQIGLYAYDGVTLAPGAVLTVAGAAFDSAGKGGLVDIETGEARLVGQTMTDGVGWIDLQAGALIDLSVAGGPGGVLHLRAPQITGTTGANRSGAPIPTAVNAATAGTDVAIKPLDATIRNPLAILVEGFQVFDLTGSGGAISTTSQNAVNANGTAFAANTATIVSNLTTNWAAGPNAGLSVVPDALLHVQPGEELVSRATLPVTLGQAGGSLKLTAGSALSFASGVPAGDVVTFNVAVVVTDSSGNSISYAAGTALTTAQIGAGSTVTPSGSGSLTFTSGTSAIALTLNGTGTATTGSGAPTTVSAISNGVGVSLTAGGQIVALAAGTAITLPNGVPTGDVITTSVGGTLVIPINTSGNSVAVVPGSGTIAFTNLLPLSFPAGESIVVGQTGGTPGGISGTASITLQNGQSLGGTGGVTIPITTLPTGDTLTIPTNGQISTKGNTTTFGLNAGQSFSGVTGTSGALTISFTMLTAGTIRCDLGCTDNGVSKGTSAFAAAAGDVIYGGSVRLSTTVTALTNGVQFFRSGSASVATFATTWVFANGGRPVDRGRHAAGAGVERGRVYPEWCCAGQPQRQRRVQHHDLIHPDIARHWRPGQRGHRSADRPARHHALAPGRQLHA